MFCILIQRPSSGKANGTIQGQYDWDTVHIRRAENREGGRELLDWVLLGRRSACALAMCTPANSPPV